MEVFTMVVLIVAIACGTSVVTDYLKTQRSRISAGAGQDDLLAELESLRQRVAVLEQIVTDDGYHLHREIDRLQRQS